CRMARARSPLSCPLPPFGPSAARRRLLCPRLTSAPRSDRLATTPVPRDTAQTSRGKTDRLRHTPAGSTTPTLDGRGLRDHWLAPPAGLASLSCSCPSGRDFAPRFLQTSSRDDALALR